MFAYGNAAFGCMRKYAYADVVARAGSQLHGAH